MELHFRTKLQGDWPYRAARFPVFYGWVILALSTLGFLMSIPGQTMGMAVFADAFIESTGLTRTQLSTAYLIGTLGSAFLLPRAGRWYDQHGARVMLVASSLMLGAMVATLGFVDLLAESVAATLGVGLPLIAFPALVIGYFGVRFAGQGVLTSVSTNMLLVWFEKRRGMVSGIRGVFVSLGFSIAPLLIAILMDAVGWRAALFWMAGVVGLGFALIALIVARDHPRVTGLQADGAQLDTPDTTQQAGPDFTLADARSTLSFWLYSLSLAIHALIATAITFHVVAIFGEAGMGRDKAFGFFIPQAIVSVTTILLGSTLADYTRLKPILVAMLVAFIFGAIGLANLHTTMGYWTLVGGLGVGGGLWGVLSNLAFIRQYGALHLGEITGLHTSLTVTASAIGPVCFSLALDYFGSFVAAAYVCLGILSILLVVSLVAAQPLDQSPRR